MTKKHILTIVLNICVLMTYAQSFQVGHISTSYTDSVRSNRNVTVEIYYPADSAGDNVSVSAGQFPVIVFGHGFVMTWDSYDNIWNAIVPEGYIMVFLTTEGSFSPSHTDFAKDMAFMVRTMRGENLNVQSEFYGSVDYPAAVMGHSMGGGASFLAIQYEPTISALATLAPAVTNPSSVTAAQSITVPSVIFAGANDCITPPAQHQIPMYDSLASSCKKLITITGASHCQFANYNFNCSFGELTCSPSATISDTVQHNIVSTLLIPWLDFQLKADCNAGTQFELLAGTSALVTTNQNCLLSCTGINEVKEEDLFSVYPNPFSTETVIRFKKEMNGCILKLFDSQGRVIRQMIVSGREMRIHSDNLSDGIYFLGLYGEKTTTQFVRIIFANEK